MCFVLPSCHSIIVSLFYSSRSAVCSVKSMWMHHDQQPNHILNLLHTTLKLKHFQGFPAPTWTLLLSVQQCSKYLKYQTFLQQTPDQTSNSPYNECKAVSFQSKCQRSMRISTWCQPRWDLPSDSTRRSKSSCRCLQDDRLWWHESTGRTGDACRLCNVCREESQICDTDRDEEGRQEWIKRTGKNIHLLPYLSGMHDRNICFCLFPRQRGFDFCSPSSAKQDFELIRCCNSAVTSCQLNTSK